MWLLATCTVSDLSQACAPAPPLLAGDVQYDVSRLLMMAGFAKPIATW